MTTNNTAIDLKSRALLCKLSVSKFNPKRADKKVTNEILNEKNAKNSAGVFVKNLIDPKALDSITSAEMRARLQHYKFSLPWADEGWRILPSTIYMKYQEAMRESKQEFLNEVDKFLNNYDMHVEQAKRALNSMFEENEYQSKDQVKNLFAFNIDFLPMPSSDDFRVKLTSGELEEIKKDVDERLIIASETAMKNLWERLITPIKAISEKLNDGNAIFRDSLISNLEEIIDLIPSLNLANDKNLNQIANECREKLAQYKPNTLRNSKRIRADVAKQADELLKRMAGYV
jgi:hypothetical protein